MLEILCQYVLAWTQYLLVQLPDELMAFSRKCKKIQGVRQFFGKSS